MHHMAQPHILQYKVSVLVVHYSLDFITYKAASGGGFSFDVGLQRMRCKRLQGKALGPKIRTSEDPTVSFLLEVIIGC